MAASGLRMYNEAKKYLMDGTIDLDVDGDFYIHLAQSGSNASTYTLSALSEITNELASANGYNKAGNILTAQTWSANAASTMRFDGSVDKWSANGGNLGSASASMNIAYAFLVAVTGTSAKDGANKLMGWWNLTATPFQVTDTNSLTLTINASGIFELSGATT